jgi:hypothetical protein
MVPDSISHVYHVRVVPSRAMMNDLAMVASSPSDDATATW